ncbi:ABC transporter substrate-binding protein [Bacillus swezeyi]|uniref:ABC transporter ATP-binding protein n=1 Tax=Bacillus swezeyi TaxID=1925020 RepID=A0A1R1QM71_9BACI|nr:ABC transporter substrate-binding protein [Bacillus swezeyi]MEC1260148.1 ABC transporter substrate-binding protein [Bacillus swezeyi]MED2927065.1 ABC transporter substrate-binding protein [Bacillus swezeyi]MED2964831.1 ABC transporter substrate-binding protein [Bacillus swezeyi]MED3072888.1 ABC transporter substrate-binding protein [Bacillus swezeyi]MED3082925.1 ABC transporter substrate-binding protein [Bacillus swezeyi]
MKRNISVLFILSLVLMLLLSACGGGGGQQSKKSDTVVIGVYGGDWEKYIKPSVEAFEKDTGLKVKVVSGTDSEWYTKLKASNGKNAPYDLLILQPDTIQRAQSADLLEPIDQEKVPNLSDLYRSVQKRFTFDGKQYAAGFSMGQLGIAYRKDLVPQEPKRWTDLWNSSYQGHVAISSPAYSAGLQFLSGLINAQGGLESNQRDMNKAFNSLADLKKNVVAFPDNPGSIQTLLERGDAWVVPFWDGRAFSLQHSGLDLGFAYPEEGAVAAVASWALMKGSPNEENAYKLLNHLISPDVQKDFSDKTYYGMTNKKVKYSDDLKGKVKVGEAYYSNLKWVDYETAAKELGDWTNRWNQVLGGK